MVLFAYCTIVFFQAKPLQITDQVLTSFDVFYFNGATQFCSSKLASSYLDVRGDFMNKPRSGFTNT